MTHLSPSSRAAWCAVGIFMLACLSIRGWGDEFTVIHSDVELAANTAAEKLWFYGPKISDQGLQVLESMPKVQAIGFGDGDVIGDEGMAHLRTLVNLTELHLDSERITDAGLANLKGLKKLEVLSITGPRITDAGVAHLKGLVNLTSLFIPRTAKVSQAVMRDLQQALPNCTIKR